MKTKNSLFFFILITLLIQTTQSFGFGPKPQTTEQTLAIIKPTAVREGRIGAIIEKIENAKLGICALKMTKLSQTDAESFYAEHRGKPFFAELVTMMSSGHIVALVAEGDDAINRLRELVGATDPQKAANNTIRKMYGKSMTENAIHASDSAGSAIREIPFFFNARELYPAA